MLIETHAHLDFPEYRDDLDAVIERAKSSQVGIIINVASSIKGSFSSVELANKYACIYACCGVHPHDAKEVDDCVVDRLRELVNTSSKVVAIGEIGLDFFRNLSPREMQYDIFVKFLRLAKELDLPLILHCREESQDAREAQDMLFKAIEENLEKPFKGVLHCFSGDEEFLERAITSGLNVSFTCNVTYKKADRLREVLKKVPIEKLLLETDSPFLAPQEKRGQRNEPAYLTHLVDAISENNGVSKEELIEATTKNAKLLFNLK